MFVRTAEAQDGFILSRKTSSAYSESVSPSGGAKEARSWNRCVQARCLFETFPRRRDLAIDFIRPPKTRARARRAVKTKQAEKHGRELIGQRAIRERDNRAARREGGRGYRTRRGWERGAHLAIVSEHPLDV